MPSGFGEYWPDGEPEGWGERLKAYYMEQAPEGQKALFDYVEDGLGNAAHLYPGYVSGKFISEVGTKDGPDRPPFTSIKGHEAPRSFKTTKGYNSLGSLIMLTDRMLAVDDALKAIIERLEPGVHQFFPIEIAMPRGKVFPKSYYVLVIGRYCDSFSPERSKEGTWRERGPGRYSHVESKKGVTGLALSKAKFGNAHLWRERGLREWLTCFSDELQAEITSAGLRIPKHYRMMEI